MKQRDIIINQRTLRDYILFKGEKEPDGQANQDKVKNALD